MTDIAAQRTSLSSRRRALDGDTLFRLGLTGVSIVVIGLLAAMILDTVEASLPVWARFGLDFIVGQRWSPSFVIYGALPFIYGTVATSAIAMLIAVPVA